ncbi:diaminopropionate ammonia-lyase family protein [Rhexocercosporidium sp. MPI-PUGE-AT-0058]|nr:diaminopropionate ammonia-lyase family protein [Rhexocercosporidium sp. MPI-PUGE-AT-0058]
MSTTPLPRSIYTNPAAASYSSSPSEALTSNTVFDFHTSLPTYIGPSELIPLANLATSLHLKNLYLKDESHRFRDLPSFKPLGLSWGIRNGIITELSEETPISPTISLSELAIKAKEAQMKLIAASDGKFGQAVARLGKLFGVEGINTRIFIPGDAEESVKGGVRREGAEAIVVDGGMEEAVREAWLHSVAVDGVLVDVEEDENYEDIPRWIVEGYSTIFKELDTQLGGKGPDWIVVPVGIGGLAQAAVTHYKAPRLWGHVTRVLTVEPTTAASLHESLRKGEISAVEVGETIMKGMKYGTVAKAAWPILKEGVDASTVVGDAEVEEAMGRLKKEGVDVGPCGGAVLAALENVLNDNKLRLELGLEGEVTIALISTEGLGAR